MTRRLSSRSMLAAAALALAVTVPPSPEALAQSPTKVAKACAAARNRVSQQQKAIADDDLRIERERRSRFACGSQKACRRYDRRIESLEKRKAEHEAILERLRATEAKACG